MALTFCEQIAELRARVEELEAMLGLSRDQDRIVGLSACGLRPAEARFMMALYAAKGRVVERGALLDVASLAPDYTRSNLVSVYASRLRARLGRDVIATTDRGYRITEVGIKACEAAWAA